MLRQLSSAAHLIFRHRLPERDGGGFHRLIADGAVRCSARRVEALLDPGKIVSLSATDAAGVGGITMQFDDVIGREARYLMQIVDVLGDDGGEPARFIEPSQRAMAASRLCRGEGRLHRKAPPPCLVPRVLAGGEFIQWDRTGTV